jgi:hypothetical protein
VKASTEILLDILKDFEEKRKEYEDIPNFDIPESEEEIEKLFYCGEISDWTREALSEFRDSYDEETDIEHDWSRHYESKSVAKRLNNGKWVGYTYWFGGGKHGESEAIDWIDEAYFLNCEEKMVMKNFFTKVE